MLTPRTRKSRPETNVEREIAESITVLRRAWTIRPSKCGHDKIPQNRIPSCRRWTPFTVFFDARGLLKSKHVYHTKGRVESQLKAA